MNQYSYEDYSDFSKRLAKNYTMQELQDILASYNNQRKSLSANHEKSIKRSSSMTSNSQRRAQGRNAVVANYEMYRDHKFAIEIYIFFPEKTKEKTNWKNQFAKTVIEAYIAGGGNYYDAMEYFIKNYC